MAIKRNTSAAVKASADNEVAFDRIAGEVRRMRKKVANLGNSLNPK